MKLFVGRDYYWINSNSACSLNYLRLPLPVLRYWGSLLASWYLTGAVPEMFAVEGEYTPIQSPESGELEEKDTLTVPPFWIFVGAALILPLLASARTRAALMLMYDSTFLWLLPSANTPRQKIKRKSSSRMSYACSRVTKNSYKSRTRQSSWAYSVRE